MNSRFRNEQKPFIIPLFLPHAGCPYRCVFCNQIAITGENRSRLLPETLHRQVRDFLSFKNEKRKSTQIAFYGGNFLGMQQKTIKALLAEAAAFVESGAVDGIRFSTRPDTIDRERLEMLSRYPVTTVELGVQSMVDEVLNLSNRGHSVQHTEKAVELLKSRHYNIGLQMMLGLPGDTDARALETARKLAALEPDVVRIYPTVVLKGSPLASQYREGTYIPLSLDAAVSLTKEVYLIFEAHAIDVIRMGLQSSEDLDTGSDILAGPYHPAFGHLVFSELFLDKARASLASEKVRTGAAVLKVHSRNLSKLRGNRNQNLRILKKEFGLTSIQTLPDDSLPENEIKTIGFSPMRGVKVRI